VSGTIFCRPKQSLQSSPLNSLLFRHCSVGGNPISIFYSTSPTVNSLYEGTLRSPILQSAEQDDNFDGKVERIEVAVKLPLAPSERITGFSGLFYHDVKLSSKARYMFDAISYVNYDSAASMSNLYVDGDIIVRQTQTLMAKGGYVSSH
jgi:hypothetical protein